MSFTSLEECEHKRDQEHLEGYLNSDNACAILFDQGRPSLRPTGGLQMVHPKKLVGQNIADPGPLFLGTRDGVPIFAFHIQRDNEIAEMESFQDMRVVAAQLSPTELALAGRAKSLLEWHASHTFCAKCGKQSFPQRGGTSRKCPSCGTDHFPRVNPVTIMLVVNGFSREQVEAVFAKRSDVFTRPPRFTIAHQLLRHWLEETA